MRLRITDVNFTTKYNWLFKLANTEGNIYFIMNESFYKTHQLKSPITKKELDYYDRGQWINATVKEIEGQNIVISL